MSYQEKRSIVNIISTLLISGIYYWYVFSSHPEEGMSTDELLKFWAKTLLIMIPVAIVSKIVTYILFSIIHKVATNEDLPDFDDERDKLIELKSNRFSHYTFGMGFLLSMIALTMGYSVNVMFIIIVTGGIVGEILENIAQLYLYRRGF